MPIRSEEPSDVSVVWKVVEEAFNRPTEAELIDRVRADGDVIVSAVAVEQGTIIGHALFSRMGAPFRAVGLGPVAVKPKWQRKGIGSQLIFWGLEKLAEDGWQGVFVLGDPRFYKRFGFELGVARGFVSPYAGPNFMALGLGGPLPVTTGTIAYPSAFSALPPSRRTGH